MFKHIHTHTHRLSEKQQERIKSDKPPRDSIVPEPMFWAHYDHDATTTKITLVYFILYFLIFFFYHDATTTKITLFFFYFLYAGTSKSVLEIRGMPQY